MNRAAFLDRDGVINRKAPGDGYVTCWEDMHLLPGVAQAVSLLNKAQFKVIVVSNQRCVAKGLVTTADVDAIHRRLCKELAAAGAVIDGVYYCPHEEQPPCDCRKPEPGMLLSAALQHDLDLAASWMIGDSEVDITAGKKAGCKTVRLIGIDKRPNGSADVIASSLIEAVPKILSFSCISCDKNNDL